MLDRTSPSRLEVVPKLGFKGLCLHKLSLYWYIILLILEVKRIKVMKSHLYKSISNMLCQIIGLNGYLLLSLFVFWLLVVFFFLHSRSFYITKVGDDNER